MTFDFFGKLNDDYDGYDDEPYKTPRHLFIEDSIIAEEQEDGQWWVINGHWYGHIDEYGEFICDYTNKSCGKKIGHQQN